jgi:hypothetical protein
MFVDVEIAGRLGWGSRESRPASRRDDRGEARLQGVTNNSFPRARSSLKLGGRSFQSGKALSRSHAGGRVDGSYFRMGQRPGAVACQPIVTWRGRMLAWNQVIHIMNYDFAVALLQTAAEEGSVIKTSIGSG